MTDPAAGASGGVVVGPGGAPGRPFGTTLSAMVTPFGVDGCVDLDAVGVLATRLVDQGNDGLVVNGTTGESPESPKIRRLHRDPRASLLVATPVGERERRISITGHVTIHSDGADDLLARLFARYWDDLEDPTRAKELADMSAGDWVRLVIHPETIRRFAN